MCPVPLLSNGLLFVISVSCLIILLQDAAGEAVLEGINRLSSLYEELLLRGPLFILIWASKPHVLGPDFHVDDRWRPEWCEKWFSLLNRMEKKCSKDNESVWFEICFLIISLLLLLFFCFLVYLLVSKLLFR